MRASIYKYITDKKATTALVLTVLILAFFVPSAPYLAGLGVVILILWSSNWQWKKLGIGIPHLGQTTMRATAYAIILFVATDFFLTPLIELLFGKIDYTQFEGLRGNLNATILFILIMWAVAAIGEELVFRGYYLNQLAKLFGYTKQAWIIGILISSLIFGLVHQYQGISGVIQTGLLGIALSIIFYKNQTNLLLPMLVHGFYNTIGILLIFLNQERAISDFILQLLTN